MSDSIEVYVRHTDICDKRHEGPAYKRCKCPKWLYGTIPGKGPRSRVSAKTRSWEKAAQTARSLESGKNVEEAIPEQNDQRVTIAHAVDEYLKWSIDQGAGPETMKKKTR